MATNQMTLLRQWHMLRLIPRYPSKATAQVIKRKLASADFEVTERTIQRDLQELSEVFPLTADEREKPFGWSWQKDAPSFDLPGLGVSEALTLILVEQHLHDFLPPSALEHLQPYFKAAANALNTAREDGGNKAWLGKVRSVPAAQPLLPPAFDQVVQRNVYEALLRDRQLKLDYRKKGERGSVEYVVHPLAVVQRGPILYLVCTFFEYTDIRLLALHRVVSAEMTEASSRRPKGFSIDAVIASGIMGFGGEEQIQIEVIFKAEQGAHLYETAISKTQRLEVVEDGRIRLTATVIDTCELRWWLQGFGPNVEVVGPADLRDAIAAASKETSAIYN